jgi:hypothetical protein
VLFVWRVINRVAYSTKYFDEISYGIQNNLVTPPADIPARKKEMTE